MSEKRPLKEVLAHATDLELVIEGAGLLGLQSSVSQKVLYSTPKDEHKAHAVSIMQSGQLLNLDFDATQEVEVMHSRDGRDSVRLQFSNGHWGEISFRPVVVASL